MDTDGTSSTPRRRRRSTEQPGGAGGTPRQEGGRADAGREAEPGPVAVPVERSAKPAAAALSREGLNLSEATLASLDLERGAIGRLDAQDVSVSQGAIGAARAEAIQIQFGALGAGMANQLEVSQAGIGTLLAGDARLEQAAVRTLVARDVVVERPTFVAFLIARRVSGDVRVLFDWRGALAFGLVVGLVSRLGRGRG